MTDTLRLVLGCCLLAVASCWSVGARAAVLEEFTFDDVAGTAYNAAANSANAGHLFDEDADLDGVVTNGSGQLNASLKANNEFGTIYVDSDLVSSGSYYGVMELTYDFDPNTLDDAENEEIRLSFISFDPRSTFVTTEFEIQREDDNTLTLLGNGVGTGATDLGPVLLPGLSQQGSPLVVVLSANLDASRYQVHYSADGGTSFTSLGAAGFMEPGRAIDSLRLTLNNDLSQDDVLLDYFAFMDENPYPGLIRDISTIPEPAGLWLAALAPLWARGRRWRR